MHLFLNFETGSPLNKKSKMKGGRHTIASSRGRPTSRANRVSSSIVSQLERIIFDVRKQATTLVCFQAWPDESRMPVIP